jgi:hypothetical protein
MRDSAFLARGLKATARALILAACAAGTTASAQSSQGQGRVEPISPFSTFYFTTGTLLMDVSKLNPRFERLDLDPKDRPGFYTISNDGYSIGIGGYGSVMRRLVLGGELHIADLGQEANPSGKTNQLTTNYWMGTLGYAIYTSWRVNVVPFLGIGTGSVKLTLKNRNGGATVPDTQDPTFDEVILSPGSQSVMKGNYVMVQPGLGADVLLLRQETDRIGITLGVRFSSQISPNRTTWKYKGREVFGGPDVGPTGGVVRVVAGIGGFRLGASSKNR